MERPAGYSSLRRVGDIKTSLRPRDHDGWILMDGRTIHRAVYPRFFDAIEIPGDTVVVPDGRDALLLGAGGRLKLMQRGGSNTITLTIEHLPPHDHDVSDSTAETTTAKGGLLAGVLSVLSGLTVKTVSRKTGLVGGGKPVPLAPVAIGAKHFVYVGQS